MKYVMLVTKKDIKKSLNKNKKVLTSLSRYIHPQTYLLDSGCSKHVYKTLDDLSHVDSEPHKVMGVSGTPSLGNRCHHRVFGEGTLLEQSPANLLSISQLVSAGFKVNYHEADNSFSVTKNDIKLRFRCINDLYQTIINKNYQDLAGISIQDDGILNDEQKRRARNARNLHNSLGHPSDVVLCQLLDSKSLIGCSLSRRDVENAKTLLGDCRACVAGKMTRHAEITIDQEHQDVIGSSIHCDIFYFTGPERKKDIYLLGIDEATGFLMIERINSRRKEDLLQALNTMINYYSSYGHKVKTIHTDGESGISALESEFKSRGIRLYSVGAETHEKRSERAIRTTKERARSIAFGLPFKLPRILNRHLLKYAIEAINLVPNVHTAGRPPYQLLTGQAIDQRALDISFGDIVMMKSTRTDGNEDMARASLAVIVGRELENNRKVMAVLLHNKQIVRRDTYAKVERNLNDAIKIIESWKTDVNVELNTTAMRQPTRIQVPIGSNISEQNNNLNDDLEIEEKTPDREEESKIPDSPVVKKNAQVDMNISMSLPMPKIPDSQGTTEWEPAQVLAPTTTTVAPSVVEGATPGSPNGNGTVLASQPVSVGPKRVSSRARTQRKVYEPGTSGMMVDDVVFISLNAAMKEDPMKVIKAMNSEFEQMKAMKVYQLMHRRDTVGKTVVPGVIIYDPKKSKVRICAGGHRQDRSLYSNNEISSSTVKAQSLLMLLAVSAGRGMKITTADVKGAYLNAELPEGRFIYMKLSKIAVDILSETDKTYEAYRDHTGSVYVKLDRALYGLVESAKLWNDHVSATLKNLGLVQLKNDACVFMTPNQDTFIGLYVDDFIICSVNEKERERILNGLEKAYGKLKQGTGKKITYRGLQIVSSDSQEIFVNQTEYAKELTKHVRKTARTPTAMNFLKVNKQSEPCQKAEKEEYARTVAKILWLANQSRPDLKFATSLLCSRVSDTRIEDLKKMKRVLEYIKGTLHLGLRYRREEIILTCHADASYLTHDDMKGQSGVIVCLGNSVVEATSVKQKLTAQSSTEAELIALSEAVNTTLWTRSMLEEMGFAQQQTIIYQDNQSALCMAESGKLTKRSKHIGMRFYNIKDHIESKEIQLKHISTKKMIADMLTKPLSAAEFQVNRDKVMSKPTVEESIISIEDKGELKGMLKNGDVE